ncbi:hypothetical protein AJ79_10358, partial [Helicocarpus griseus UAMH5409]
WPQHLARRNLQHLAHISHLPDQDEKTLQEVIHLLDLLMNQAVAGLFTLNQKTQQWLKSLKASESDVQPLSHLQNSESQD